MASASNHQHNLYQTIKGILTDLQGEYSEAALARLHQLNPQEAVPILQQLLFDLRDERFEIALNALVLIDEHAFFDSARQLITHEQDDVRWYICEMLSEYRADSLLPALLDTAQHDSEPDVRCSAILALAGWSDARVFPVLQAILHHDREMTSKGDRIAQIARRVLADNEALRLQAEVTIATEQAQPSDCQSIRN